VPKLTLCVQFEDGVVTDVALSPNTRTYLQALAAKQNTPENELVDTKDNLQRSVSAASSLQ
jgi:hypothetical protein